MSMKRTGIPPTTIQLLKQEYDVSFGAAMEEDRQLRLQGMSIPSDLKSLQVQAKLEKALIWEATTNGDDDE